MSQIKVIDFVHEKNKRNVDKLTSEQKFKLMVLETICNVSQDQIQEVLERGISIDSLFTNVANNYFEIEKAIRR